MIASLIIYAILALACMLYFKKYIFTESGFFLSFITGLFFPAAFCISMVLISIHFLISLVYER